MHTQQLDRFSPDDERFMASALALGRRGLGNTRPNPAVGAVVVRDYNGARVVVGRGWTQPGGRPHAETEALRRAGAAARGATLYVTLEPCSHHGVTPPCAEAVINAGISRVFSAIDDPNPEVAGHGHALLRAAGIAVETGLGAREARRNHAGHFHRIADARPHVTLKLAVSADGKAGLAARKPAAITGEAARARVHLMRAMNDAILIGVGTALADDPLLTCRLPGMAARSPVRVVLDTSLRLPRTSALVRSAAETPLWVVAGLAADAGAEVAMRAQGVEVIRCEAGDDGIEVASALRHLAARGVTRLLVEGGPRIAAAVLSIDMVDEAALFTSSRVIGADGIDALEGLPLATLTASPQLRSLGLDSLGEDTLEMFERVDQCSPASSPISAR